MAGRLSRTSKPPPRAVVGPRRPAVGFHDLRGNGETDALAAAIAVAGFGHAVKRLEDTLELARGNPRSAVANRDREPRRAAFDCHLHGRTLRTIAHGVTQHVLDRAAQQLPIAAHHAMRRPDGLHLAALGGAFERGIAHHLVDHLVDVERLALEGYVGAVEARELQHLADEHVETLDLALHPIELTCGIGARLAREAEREAHPREGRAQLVRDIAQEPREGAAIGAQPVGHGVEFAREHRDLVLAALEARAHAHVETLRRRARARPPACAGSARSSAARATSSRTRSRRARCREYARRSRAGSARRRCSDGAAPATPCRPCRRAPRSAAATRCGRKLRGGGPRGPAAPGGPSPAGPAPGGPAAVPGRGDPLTRHRTSIRGRTAGAVRRFRRAGGRGCPRRPGR